VCVCNNWGRVKKRTRKGGGWEGRLGRVSVVEMFRACVLVVKVCPGTRLVTNLTGKCRVVF